MMRLTSIRAGVPIAALALLAGCATGGVPTSSDTAGGTDGASAGSALSEGEVTGTITVWSWDVAATSLTRLAKDFQAAHPGTTVEVVDVGYDNAYDKISVGMQAGTGLPDVLTMESDRMAGYLDQFPTQITDLTAVAGDMKADFAPSKWADYSGSDGDIYGLPWDIGPVGLYYRSDYLQEAGVDPATLTTWDDLVTAAKTIKDKTGASAISIDVSTGGTFLMLLQQQGLGIFDAEGNITVNTAKAVATAEFLQKLNDEGLLNNVRGWDGRVTATKEGKSAFHAEAAWWIGTLEGDMPELSGKFGVVPLPVFDSSDATTSNNGGSGLIIPTQAKNPRLAWEFTKFVLADTANEVSMMKEEGLFPSYLPALSDPLFDQADPYFSDQKVNRLFADAVANIPPVNYTKDAAAATDIVANAVVAVVLNGKDAKTQLDAAAQQIATATGRSIAAS